MIKNVFASRGAERFHASPGCSALRGGQDLYGGWGTFTVGKITEVPVTEAFDKGLLPCAQCFPGGTKVIFQERCADNFGHVPVEHEGLFGQMETVCARCTEGGYYEDLRGKRPIHVTWPCMSAIVLGLVPGPERKS